MNEYEKYNCKSKIDFLNVAKALNALVSFYLNRHFSSKIMLKDLEEETGLNAELCSYIVNINYGRLSKIAIEFYHRFSAGTAESLRSKKDKPLLTKISFYSTVRRKRGHLP